MYRNVLKVFQVKNNVFCGQIIKRFAGHSKWANIKHIKAAKDSQKSFIFTRLSRQIKVAIQEGGSINPSTNSKLAQIIEQAKRLSMPVASIQSVIKSTQNDKEQCKTYMLEVKGPGGSIILFEIFTPNLIQTKQQIATILRKHKGAFTDGGGKHLFDHKGIIVAAINDSKNKPEELLEIATNHAIEAGAEDVSLLEDKYLEFICCPNSVSKVQNVLSSQYGYNVTSASAEYIPQSEKMVTLNEDELILFDKLYEKLEALNDIVRIFDNVS